jgi:hypothetical protein
VYRATTAPSEPPPKELAILAERFRTAAAANRVGQLSDVTLPPSVSCSGDDSFATANLSNNSILESDFLDNSIALTPVTVPVPVPVPPPSPIPPTIPPPSQASGSTGTGIMGLGSGLENWSSELLGSMGNETGIENMDTSKIQTSLGAGYHQCKVSKRGRVSKEVFDISVEKVGTKLSVNPEHLSSFDQQFENAIENCFIGTRNTPTCKQNISSTFDPRDLSCVICQDSHSALVSRGGGGNTNHAGALRSIFPPTDRGGGG